jgi:hypothetical protein
MTGGRFTLPEQAARTLEDLIVLLETLNPSRWGSRALLLAFVCKRNSSFMLAKRSHAGQTHAPGSHLPGSLSD